MATTTANLGLILPAPNVDTGWGTTLNNDFSTIDALFAVDGTGTPVNLNVGIDGLGNKKTLVISGNLVLGSGDKTTTAVAPFSMRGAAKINGSDLAGIDLTFLAGNGTGTGGSGKFIFQTAPVGVPGSTPNSLANALVIGKSSDAALVDIGAGGTGSTNAGATVRVNGSSAGIGTNGGSALYIANNGTNAGAFGNRSNIFAGTTAYDASATVWGKDSLSFVVGSGTLAASNEKMKLGSSGQLYFWDTSLGSPALNAGTAGQVLTSTGSSGEPQWKNVITYVTPTTFGTGGVNFENIPSTAKTIIITFTGLDPDSGVNALVRIGSGSYVNTGYNSAGSVFGASSVSTTGSTNASGFIIAISGIPCSGSVRLTTLGGDTWVCDYTAGGVSGAVERTSVGGGSITLGGTLDRVQIIPASGNLVAGGKVTIQYY